MPDREQEILDGQLLALEKTILLGVMGDGEPDGRLTARRPAIGGYTSERRRIESRLTRAA